MPAIQRIETSPGSGQYVLRRGRAMQKDILALIGFTHA